jgi:di/tricarboxylate transporter
VLAGCGGLRAGGPGKYRFADFFKVGLPLTFIIFGIAILLVPRVWPPVGS